MVAAMCSISCWSSSRWSICLSTRWSSSRLSICLSSVTPRLVTRWLAFAAFATSVACFVSCSASASSAFCFCAPVLNRLHFLFALSA